VQLNGQPYAVIGVMPPGFQFAPFWTANSEIWAPLDLQARAAGREDSSLRIFGRRRKDVSLSAARAEIAAITAVLERDFPGTNRGVTVTPLHEGSSIFSPRCWCCSAPSARPSHRLRERRQHAARALLRTPARNRLRAAPGAGRAPDDPPAADRVARPRGARRRGRAAFGAWSLKALVALAPRRSRA
jgi:hypothetical protein